MANEQGWRDFRQITSSIDRAKHACIEINNLVNRLKHDKTEIFDDATRKAEAKKIVDIHPLYTITGLQDDFAKLVALQTFLEDNEYLT